MSSCSPSSSPLHRIKLSWEGSNQVLSIEPTMTFQQLGAKAKEFLWKTKKKTISNNVNPEEEEEKVQGLDGNAATSFSVSLSMITTDKTGDVSAAGTQEIEWENNSLVLVRDIIPNLSLVYCKRFTGKTKQQKQKHENNEPARQPPKKRPRETKQQDEVVDLLSSSSDEDDVDDVIVFPSSKSKKSPPMTRLDDPRNPTSVKTPGEYWIWQTGPTQYADEEKVLGKWLLFRNSDTIDMEWKRIAMAVKSGQIRAANSKVATYYNNTMNPNASRNNYVICVYTSEQRMIEVGKLLIPLVKHDIRYKTDEATLMGVYGPNSTCQTLYWNNGNPSTERLLWTKSQQVQSAKEAQKVVSSVSGTSASNDMVPFNNIILTVNGLQHAYYKSNNNRNHPGPLAGKSVKLIREPNNSYDKNAIRVDLTTTNITTIGNEKVGYIQKDQAGVLAPWMDRNLVCIQKATMRNVQGGDLNHKSAPVLLKGMAHLNAKEILDRHNITTAPNK